MNDRWTNKNTKSIILIIPFRRLYLHSPSSMKWMKCVQIRLSFHGSTVLSNFSQNRKTIATYPRHSSKETENVYFLRRNWVHSKRCELFVCLRIGNEFFSLKICLCLHSSGSYARTWPTLIIFALLFRFDIIRERQWKVNGVFFVFVCALPPIPKWEFMMRQHMAHGKCISFV